MSPFRDNLAREGVSEILDVRGPIGIMAFHGGALERVTDVIAAETARLTEERRSRAGIVTASPSRNAAPARQRNPSTTKINTGGYPRKETSFFRIRDPNAIIPRPMKISMWPVDVL